MKIVNIRGGLGNQMFQCAFAMLLKHMHPEEEVYIDTHHYHTIFLKKCRRFNLHNGYEIANIFPKVILPIASFRKVAKLSYWIPNYTLSRLGRRILPIRKPEYVAPYSMNYSYDKDALEVKGDCYYEGYWQSVHYYSKIKEELQKVYAHPDPNIYNADLIKKIEGCNSVGIHIRRGDYLNEPEFHNICGLEYYKMAIKDVMKDGENHVFFVFSNDINWCKKNITPIVKGQKILYVTGNTGRESCWDMFLMSHCKHLIMANSSFSWWGAFLNKQGGRVYAPQPWLNRDCEIDIYEDSWIKVHS